MTYRANGRRYPEYSALKDAIFGKEYGNWDPVPRCIARNPGLEQMHKYLLVWCVGCATSDSCFFTIDLNELADDMKMQPEEAECGINRMVEWGLLERRVITELATHGKNDAVLYRINMAQVQWIGNNAKEKRARASQENKDNTNG